MTSRRDMPSKRPKRPVSFSLDADKARCHLLQLSDELLLLIGKAIAGTGDLFDLGNFRLTCKKLRNITEDDMFETISIALSEDPSKFRAAFKLRCVPQQIIKIRHLTILNQPERSPGRAFEKTISRRGSRRVERWVYLEQAADKSCREFNKSAFLSGSQFNWHVKLATDQLLSFQWRHAVPLSIDLLTKILTTHAQSLQKLELSMIKPMSHREVRKLDSDLALARPPSKIRSLIYRGLSHTEPAIVNGPERGGRFRMLRPIFKHIRNQIEELRLSQDHCISQIGKTPMFFNGRTQEDYVCDLDELFHDQDTLEADLPASMVLNLLTLELGGFQVDGLLRPTARMQLNLDKLRDLTLNDCSRLEVLFSCLISRSSELHLRSFALRYCENTDFAEVAAEVVSQMQGFLTSFEGLELLSILWQGGCFPSGSFNEVLKKHSTTLRVYVSDLRYFSEASISPHHGSFITMPRMELNTLAPFTMPQVKELGFNLMHAVKDPSEVHRLRLLSEHRNLRTVHIRNFPPIQNLIHQLPYDEHYFWRSSDGESGTRMVEVARNFAEHISRPFYEVPPEWEVSGDLRKLLTLISDSHVKERGKQLYDCDEAPELKCNSATPVKDLTNHVVEERAKVNCNFAALKAKIDLKVESEDEARRYDETLHRIRTVLGVEEPDITEKPKLRLLVVGDWTYRDQMNITGPRNYDPRAWCDTITKTEFDEENQDEEDIASNDEDEEDEDYEHPNLNLLDREYEFPAAFNHQWDASLRPVFFAITWNAKQDSNGRYRWKANATALAQKTLEGRRFLSDVRSLEHAWAS